MSSRNFDSIKGVVTGDLIPLTDGVIDIGSPTLRFGSVYANVIASSLSDPAIETNYLRFPLIAPQTIRLYSSGTTLYVDDNAGGNIILDVKGEIRQNGLPVGGNGDLLGPASSTDNAIARFDGTTGKLVQNSTATISDTGALTTTKATIPTNTGEVIKIGNNSNQTNGIPNPININLGDSYYVNAGGFPYDKAALKIRFYDNGVNYSGIGITTSQMNYVTNETTNHVFYVNGGERLRITQNGVSTAAITTQAGDLSLSSATGSNITFNSKNLTNVGSITMSNATGPRITLWSNFTLGVGASHINYNVPAACYHAITTSGVTRLQVEDGGVIANVPIQTTSIRATSTTGGTIDFNGATATNLNISGSVGTQAGNATVANTGGWDSNVSYRFEKVGKIVVMELYCLLNTCTDGSGLTTALSINTPAGCAPPFSMTIVATYTLNGTSVVGRALVDSSNINIQKLDGSAFAAGNTINLSSLVLTWFTAA